MKFTTLIFSLFLSIASFANPEDNGLTVYQDGLIIEVANFEEGDKLKLFEVETGDHILSKSYSSIDLSQLPVGSYILENNLGKSITIDRLEEELVLNGAILIEAETVSFENEEVADVSTDNEVSVEDNLVSNLVETQEHVLAIQREGNIITVVDFEEGDKLKLFEVKDTIHVLSKTTNNIDLDQLPIGVYLLENNNGDSVIIEKFISFLISFLF